MACAGASAIDAARWDRVQALFHEVADLPAEEQEAALRARADDYEIADLVRAMLREDGASTLLDRDLAETVGQILGHPDDLPGQEERRFGPYRTIAGDR